jgi:hypothetical protein
MHRADIFHGECDGPTLTRVSRQAIIGGAIRRFRTSRRRTRRRPDHDPTRSTDPDLHSMTFRTNLRIDSPRYAGASRFAGSWSAPMGELGGGACTLRDVVASTDQRGGMRWFADRDHRTDGQFAVESKSNKPGESIVSHYRPIDAENRSAESNRRGDTP